MLNLNETAPFPLVFHGIEGFSLIKLGKSTNEIFGYFLSNALMSVYVKWVVQPPRKASISSKPI